ncbi:hypothetical protein ABW21_db0201707 [Orbilia brochopaga]|nr:hypothetical protein ABW21_db0201707 [Drechslerella brochopaga]
MKSIPLLSTTLLLYASLLAPVLAASSLDLETRTTGHDLKRTSEANANADQPGEFIVILDISTPVPPNAPQVESLNVGCHGVATDNTKANVHNLPLTHGREGLSIQAKGAKKDPVAASIVSMLSSDKPSHGNSKNHKRRAISDSHPTGHGGATRRMRSKRLVSNETPTGHGGASGAKGRFRRAMADVSPTGHGGARRVRFARRAVSDEVPTGHGGRFDRKAKREVHADAPTGHGGVNV